MLPPKSRFQQIQDLQNDPHAIRNISIVAHVDHGKTTLSDSLISTNNIIHQKSVGKLRYLDSRKDEQLRGITMKSSSISLVFNHQEKNHLINLIDSPGHVEFSSEVSAALRITDGALVLVDVVEGVSAQTYTVLRQCFQERVRSILVLNKMDRLIKELLMSPQEAYVYLSQIIEQVNAILAKFIDLEKDKTMQNKKNQKKGSGSEITEDDIYSEIEKNTYFSLEQGNIVFSSAIDCWAFTVDDFSEFFSKKLECSKKVLQKAFAGEFYCNLKTKKISKKPFVSTQNIMFIDLILQNVWTIYERVQSVDKAQITKLQKSLKIPDIPEKYFTILQKDQGPVIQHIMNNWLPLDKSIMKCVIEQLPSPIQAQHDRLQIISQQLANISQNPDDLDEETYQNLEKLEKIKKAIDHCDNSDEAPLVIFISKMLYILQSRINERQQGAMTRDQKAQRFIAFARIFSGRIKKGKKVFVIQPKKEQGEIKLGIEEVEINDIYLMMAQNLERIDEVGAGNILALGDLDQTVFKSATISSESVCPSLLPIHLGAKSILKVALSAKDFKEQAQLLQGLKQLNKFDPSVEVSMLANGDVILATCGQVHLERCITDLEEMTEVEVKTSEPIVSFKETIIYKKLAVTKNLQKMKKDNWEDEKGDEEEEKNELEKKLIIIKNMGEMEEEDLVDNTIENDEEIDIRYGLQQMEKNKLEKAGKNFVNLYGQEREIKRLDYFNSGKTLASLNLVNLLEIQSKPNQLRMRTPNQEIEFTVRGIGFNFQLAQWLEKNSETMRKVFSTHKTSLNIMKQFLSQFQEQVEEHIKDKRFQKLIYENLVCFGPHLCGPNLLIDKQLPKEDSSIEKLKKEIAQREEEKLTLRTKENSLKLKGPQDSENTENKETETQERAKMIYDLYKIKPEEIKNSIVQGFNMATTSGPLCQEPMMGVCFIIEDILYLKQQPTEQKPEQQEKKEDEQLQEKEKSEQQEKPQEEDKEKYQKEEVEEVIQEDEKKEENKKEEENDDEEEEKSNIQDSESTATTKLQQPQQATQNIQSDCYGPISGQIISTVKDICLESFLGACPRLVEGMYLCHLQCDTDYYPKVWEILNQRRAQPVNDELQESSNLFLVSAHLPLIESFNFYTEMQTKTSGRVNAQLVFDTWNIQEQDPFYVPFTEDEIEAEGEIVNTPNFAKNLIDKIRKRKGLNVEQKIVVSAEKQNNIGKKR